MKALRKDHWLLQSKFSSQKKQGKPMSCAHLHMNRGKNPKCFVQLKINHYRPPDFSYFFSSQPLTFQSEINCFYRSPPTFKATSAGAHFHWDLTPTSSRANLRAPFLDGQPLLLWPSFPCNVYPYSRHIRKSENVSLNSGIIEEHSETIQQM